MLLKKLILLTLLTLVWVKTEANVIATNKTFLMPRPPGREQFVGFAGTYRMRRIADNPECERVGLSCELIPFYRRSVKQDRLGGYFGASNKSDLTYGNSSSAPDRSKVDITSENFIHNPFEFKIKYSKTTSKLYLNPTAAAQPAVSDANVGVAHVRFQDLVFNSSTKAANIPRVGGGSPGTGPFTWALLRLAQYKEQIEDFRNDPSDTPSGEFSLRPTSCAFGVRLGFYANIPRVGYFKVNVPFVRVENKLGIRFVDDSSDLFAQFLQGEYSKDYVALPATSATFDDGETSGPDVGALFTTNYSVFKDPVTEQGGAQDALTKAKIAFDKIKGDFGLGDIELVFGRRIVDVPQYDYGVFLNIVVPTSNEPKGEFLFEPIRGNGKHFELGAGIDGSIDLFNYEGFNVESFYNLGMGYIFEAHETRTLEVFLDAKIQFPWQRYFLVGEKDRAGALVPMANLTTLKVNVRPGLKVEGFVGIGINSGYLSGDFGWGFWAKEAERIRLAEEWPSGKYAVVNAADYRTYEELSLDISSPHTFGTTNNTTIEANEFDFTSAATPPQVSQTLWLSGTYLFEQKICPFSLTLGGNYEFGHDSAAMTNWMIWCKAGVAF